LNLTIWDDSSVENRAIRYAGSQAIELTSVAWLGSQRMSGSIIKAVSLLPPCWSGTTRAKGQLQAIQFAGGRARRHMPAEDDDRILTKAS
jgi:hypothetical protein